MSIRMRRPEEVRIPISRGDWLLVKKYLTAGEQRRKVRRFMREGATLEGTPEDRIDSLLIGWSRAIAYLVDWSIQDAEGKPVIIRDKSEDEIGAILDELPIDDFTEVREAIEAHEDAMEKALVQEKNVQGGETGSAQISPSLVTSTGDMSGSPNSLTTSTTS